MGSVSPDQVAIEQARQAQFALEQTLKQQLRVDNVAQPLLRAAVPLCGSNVRPISAFLVGNAYAWKGNYFPAARAIGYGDTLVVVNVTPGFAADRAGLKVGDRILEVNGSPIVTGDGAIDDFGRKAPNPKNGVPLAYLLKLRRGDDTTTVLVRPEMACSYGTQVVVSDEVNAAADGQTIYITSGILRFVSDDNELSVVIGHELGHNAMHHIDAQKKNALIGGLIGAIADVAAATQGVNTHGDFTNQGAQVGSQVFSQDFEREADYVGLYILALANQPIDGAPNFWRRMAASNPKSIKFAGTHPTTAERFVRLNGWKTEIQRKIAAGIPLMPEMKSANSATTTFGAPTERRTAQVPEDTKGSTTTRAIAAPSNAKVDRAQDQPTSGSAQRLASAPAKPKSEATPTSATPKGASATIGTPSSNLDRDSAVAMFREANRYLGNHQWKDAEAAYRQTLLLDGSQAQYHAALGKLLMQLYRFDEAEAEYTAAVLLDLDNVDYRRLVKEARSHR